MSITTHEVADIQHEEVRDIHESIIKLSLPNYKNSSDRKTLHANIGYSIVYIEWMILTDCGINMNDFPELNAELDHYWFRAF